MCLSLEVSLDHGVSVSGQKYESHSHSVHFPDFRLRKSVQQLAPKMREKPMNHAGSEEALKLAYNNRLLRLKLKFV